MAALSVTLEAVKREQVARGEDAFVATVTNAGDRPESFHRYQAEHGSLVLQIVDPSGRRVLPPPPPPPGERDLAPASSLAPGESITFRYAGFLGGRPEPGRYRVRWYATDQALGGSREAPLASEWTDIEVARAEPVVRESRFLDFILGPWRYVRTILSYALLHIRRLLCLVVEEKELDYAVSEKIENGYPTSWNGTYYWNARFRVRLDQPQQRIDVTIRLRLAGFAPVAQWINVVQAAWSQRFKDCATIGCATNGYPIYLTLQYVTSGEHYVMHLASGRTVSMLEWGVVDGDQAHEVGHMLGNKEEYFTIDGVDYGPGRQPAGNIMNNPDNPPVAAHYGLIQSTVDVMLGITYSLAGGSTRPINVPCSYA